MNKSRWSKMTKEQKAAYYAARKARKAAKAKAKANGAAVPVPEKKAPAKKVPAKKCAKKCGTACPCKKDPNVSPEERFLKKIFNDENAMRTQCRMSALEKRSLADLVCARNQHIVIDNACRVIGSALLDIIRALRPNEHEIIIRNDDYNKAK